MKRAIRVHRQDFIAILALVVAAVAVAVYILEHQPSFGFGKSYYTVKAQFASGAAVTAGQGQSVDVAGVQVGQVGAVDLTGGRAIVTMNIDKKYAPIYNNATVLLRPRTPLKDMYLSLDPGTKDAGAVAVGATLPVANTQPDINVEEILSTLDADTRNYLLLLLAGGAQAFHDPRRERARRRAPPRWMTCVGRSSGSRRSTAIPRRSRSCWRSGPRTSSARFTTSGR